MVLLCDMFVSYLLNTSAEMLGAVVIIVLITIAYIRDEKQKATIGS